VTAPLPAVPPPPRPTRALDPVGAVVVAVAAWAGALAGRPLSLLVPAGFLLVVVAARRPVLLAVPVALAASALGARALDGTAPPPPGPVAGTATLVTDPESRWGTVEAVARLEGRHVLLVADGAAGEVVAARLAGERVVVAGRLRALPDDAAWLRVRHVAAEVRARSARAGPQAAPPWRAANHVRRLLVAGAAPLGEERRALYRGLVLGDDRDQSPEAVDDFRGSGLAHLLAVSGQNVAFVLALASPGLQLLGPAGRLAAVVALLGLVAVATRCEPSVLRAVAMAGGAAVAAARGRPTPGLQLLALAVAGLVLVDPLLARSLGFQLSVAATLGILVLGPPLAAVLPGPRPLAAAASVSAAAQLGVAPLVLGAFGGVPVASLPANLLAAPAAALVMTWGLPAGLAAGALGPPWDGALHRPTDLALAALSAVARGAASVHLGEVRAPHLAVAVVALGVLVALRRGRGPWPPLRVGRVLRGLALVALAGSLVAPAVALRRPPAVHRAPGLTVWRSGGATVVVVEPGAGPAATLAGLRRAGVVQVDLLVVGPGPGAAGEERAARHRARVGRSWDLGRAPPAATPPLRLGTVEVVRTGEAAACVRLPADPPCPPGSGR